MQKNKVQGLHLHFALCQSTTTQPMLRWEMIKKPSDCIISALLNLFFKRPYFFHNALLAGQDIYQ